MSKVARIAQATLSLMVAAATVSAAPLPGFTLAAQTARFSFYTTGAKVDAEKSEQYLAKLEQMLGAKFDGHADYYRYASTTELAVATGAYAEGVTYTGQNQIHSAHGFHAHEIVHLIAGQMGNPGTMFQEGLAVVLGNDSKWAGSDVDKLAKKFVQKASALSLLGNFEKMDAQVSYPLAGSFVKGLIARHGLNKVADFFRSCQAPQDRDYAFQQTFGETYAQAVGEWAQTL
jgi:hypothetical protein